ncbi:alpha/beta-hydrolase [Lepidopterella palustris CBS 459.81]|uniref:Alpha/beta-hydrolase n=1 Tax=Lepidopterella palustris CBS 459.81 TaxID=1314670 RepID=A0A8E2E1Q6_9PEZI|nr:alpha/beta-hydrolase [Lepidopterella palustris CBS 459.81]
MVVTPIDPVSDARVAHNTALLNGQTYHYLLGVPRDGKFRATAFLIHGWPDLCMGWRYQIPFLLDMGFRVVAPDLMGFGGTDAPQVPPNPINLYGYKRAADDIAELARQLGAPKIVLGGHDWGGFVVWRTAEWHHELVTHVFSVCTPYTEPQKHYYSTEDLVKGPLPQFGYQLQLAGVEVEAKIQSKEKIRQFLNGMYGGKGPNGELAFDPAKGLLFENLPKLGKGKFFSDKELDYYVDQYSRNGMHGNLNWYRARKANWEEDQGLLNKGTIDIPTLFIQANYDSVLKPSMAKEMEKHLTNLSRGEVDASHWALIQKPDEVNAIVKKWLEKVGFGVSKSSL